jgi:hypothetical protein
VVLAGLCIIYNLAKEGGWSQISARYRRTGGPSQGFCQQRQMEVSALRVIKVQNESEIQKI